MTLPAALPGFPIDTFRLRPIEGRERDLIDGWINDDPDHRGRFNADFFLAPLPGEDGWALEDGGGRVVFYFKTQTACRLHIQFGPSRLGADRDRNRTALISGMGWLERTLSANRFREVLFDSRSPLLIHTATRRLGFTHAPDDFTRALPTLEELGRRHEARRGTPQVSDEEAS